MNETDRFFNEVNFTATGVIFHVWSPDAEEVRLDFYTDACCGTSCRSIKMKSQHDGRWQACLPLDVKGLFYTFCAKVSGVWRKPSPGLFAIAVGVNGKRGAVVDLRDTNPEGWEEDQRPPFVHPADAVIYEMHHRDFSVSADSGIRSKGKFLALTEAKTNSMNGSATGLSHLIELGVTHVHLLPSFDFASIDEAHPEKAQYNWGYDPLNYNVPEGSYATDPFDPCCRIREFKKMIMSLHQAGLRVVLDVVYNHTYTVGGSNFERLVPGYFFRKDSEGKWADGSGCGNETASEHEYMRRYMLESVAFWRREYHIDGFRFDVMGLHDIETMRQIRDLLYKFDPSMLLYGEGWSARPAAIPRVDCALKDNMFQLPGIAAFGDELRDGIRGLWTDSSDGGFLAGKSEAVESVRFGIVGGVFHPQIDYSRINHASKPWALSPWQMINYISCHDDWCLTDRLAAVFPKLSVSERLRLYKLGETILFTSQGIPLMFAGDEFFRSKHGENNSYKSSDEINAISWSNKDIYSDLFHYMCGLIQLRRQYAVFRMRTAEDVRRNLTFLPSVPGVIAYSLTEHSKERKHIFYLFFNSQAKPVIVTVPLAKYSVICHDGNISAEGLGLADGGQMRVMPHSALILVTV